MNSQKRIEGNRDILTRALDLELGNELYLPNETELESKVLYRDLIALRERLINEQLIEYEKIIIMEKPLNNHHNVILKKRNVLPAYIRDAAGKKTVLS